MIARRGQSMSPLGSPRKVKPRNALLVVAALVATIGLARGGHEVPVYPSYYPHEIRVETMPMGRAADLLRDAKLHAYLGPEPLSPDAVPASVSAVEWLGNFVVVRMKNRRRDRSGHGRSGHGRPG